MAAKDWYWKFVVDDWLTDHGVSLVSLTAQGLWFRCLCMMFKNQERRGFLEHRGKAITPAALAKSCRLSVVGIEKLLKELEEAAVFSRDEHGVIFNRRMVKDEQRRQVASENGKRGGNPKLTKGSNPVKPLDKGQDKAGDKTVVTNNYSYSSSSSFEEGVQGEEPDWLVVEAEFIDRWNQLDKVAKCSTNALPMNLVSTFRAAWFTPGWRKRAGEAMQKFPLANGAVMGLKKFLEPTTIDEILGGVHDFTKGGRTNGNRANPSQRHPDDEAEAWNV